MFSTYNNMPNNPEHFHSKFFVNDVNYIANENINNFEDAI